MFEIVFGIIIIAYLVQSAIFLAGLMKRFPTVSADRLPSATVIVAARNEEANILRCLESLEKLDYPEEKLSIIIVDDNSDDKTGEIISRFIQGKPKFRKLVSPPAQGSLRGKANAIHCAVGQAEGEIILTTDADCAVSPGWARTIASYYTDDVGSVYGYTGQRASGIFSGIQNLDFLYLLGVAAGAINFGKPLSCIGNNMSYRRSAYIEAGGYAAIPFSVTEDFELLFAISRLKKYNIIYPLDRNAYVESFPCSTIRQLYWQKVRWGRGGMNSPLRGFVVMAAGFLASLGVLISPFFFSYVVLAMIFLKFAADFLFLFVILQSLHRISSLRYFIFFELYFIFYVLALPVAVLFRKKIIWKGREF